MNTINSVDGLKNKIIEQIIATNNERLLDAIAAIFEATTIDDGIINLSSTQIEILKMSEDDLQYGHIISQEELDKLDAAWMQLD